MRSSVLLLSLALVGEAGSAGYFVPTHRVSGIGLDRDDLSDELLEIRDQAMTQSQTFGIMRDPQAVPGAKRITQDPKLQALFRGAAQQSGVPVTLLEAIAYLESWGEARAESPTGPKGIMQISEGTARMMGLKVAHATRYRTARGKVQVPGKSGKPKYRTVKHRIPYAVTVRDDRLAPARAIPAAARYLAGMETRFGGRDWAIFAYHCGQGCAAEMQELARHARGIPKDQVTVVRMFFSCSPAWNRELCDGIGQQMHRDFSPTYYFRVKRAEQLLAEYRRDPAGFAALSREYRSDSTTAYRAPHRLSVWLKHDDLVFRSVDDVRADAGQRLARALDRPGYFGYALRISADSPDDVPYLSQASAPALGALTYIAFETRRLYEETKPGEKFQPLPVTSLVEPEDLARQSGRHEALAHGSGQVFDIDYSGLPPGEQECLRFVLDDLGWDGYLGFVEDGADSLHIGCAPEARDFFTSVFREAEGQ